jgi:Cu/Ag efflux pump CusA
MAPLGAVAVGGLLVGTFLILLFIPLVFIWTTRENEPVPNPGASARPGKTE